MNDKTADDILLFKPGARQEAIKEAVEIVKKNGRTAQLTICRDIMGEHTGGEDCFCDPRTIRINEKGEILDE